MINYFDNYPTGVSDRDFCEDEKVVCLCGECGRDILDGEDMWRLNDVCYCEECVNYSKEEAVYDEEAV